MKAKDLIPWCLTDKYSLLKVISYENFIHQSWLLETGEVLTYENIPVNYPAGGIVVFDSTEEYVEAIKDVGWINDRDSIQCVGVELEDKGFPFL